MYECTSRSSEDKENWVQNERSLDLTWLGLYFSEV
jgi:hypothetical protein